MARYINEVPLSCEPLEGFQRVRAYLEGEGFEYVAYKGENVFQKGVGFWTAPTFIKVTFGASSARVEAWIKYAILPGVFLGEMGMEGFVGIAAKGKMKRCVPVIEQMLSAGAPQVPQMPAVPAPVQGQADEPAQEQVAQPVQEQTAGPVQEQTVDPVQEQVAQPVCSDQVQTLQGADAAPAQGQYGVPVQGQYGIPMQGQYGVPMPGQYGGPVPGQYGVPMQGQYGVPMPGQYGGPMQGQYGGPVPGQYGGPVPGQYGVPVQGQYGGPAQGQYGVPMQGQYPMPVMVCPTCGSQVVAGSRFCDYCGGALEQGYPGTAPAGMQPGYPGTAPAGMQPGYPGTVPAGLQQAMGFVTKAEYRRVYSSKSFQKSIMTIAIIAYVLVGINLLLVFSGLTDVMALLDVAICLGLTLGLHIRKSKGCAIGILVYGILDMIVMIAVLNQLGGWLWVVLGIAAVLNVNNVDKEYDRMMAGIRYY